MSEVNKDRVRLLVDALRSGKFRQGREALEFIPRAGGAEYCCLGVACRVAEAGGLAVHVKFSMRQEIRVEFDGCDGYLPESVREWFGFGSDVLADKRTGPVQSWDILLQTDRGRVPASVLNDEDGADFAEIADAFERTFLSESNGQDGPVLV